MYPNFSDMYTWILLPYLNIVIGKHVAPDGYRPDALHSLLHTFAVSLDHTLSTQACHRQIIFMQWQASSTNDLAFSLSRYGLMVQVMKTENGQTGLYESSCNSSTLQFLPSVCWSVCVLSLSLCLSSSSSNRLLWPPTCLKSLTHSFTFFYFYHNSRLAVSH